MHDYFRNTYGTFAMLVVVSHPLLIEMFYMYDFSKSGTAILRDGGEFRRLGAAQVPVWRRAGYTGGGWGTEGQKQSNLSQAPICVMV